MDVVALLLALAAQPTAASCTPQFAPLESGTYSGTSRTPYWLKQQAGDWGGGGWVGWSWYGGKLEPVTMTVRGRPRDTNDEQELETVSVDVSAPVAFAVRCIPGIRAGRMHSAAVTNERLRPRHTMRVSLGSRWYSLHLDTSREDMADAKVIFADGERTQVLYSADGFADEPHFEVVWAGDLDLDGRLDLITNFERKYSIHPYRLLLSSKAERGQLVGLAAVFETGN
jgi:hypothetical protein